MWDALTPEQQEEQRQWDAAVAVDDGFDLCWYQKLDQPDRMSEREAADFFERKDRERKEKETLRSRRWYRRLLNTPVLQGGRP